MTHDLLETFCYKICGTKYFHANWLRVNIITTRKGEQGNVFTPVSLFTGGLPTRGLHSGGSA